MPCANPQCAKPMSMEYRCIGCQKPVHWFCAAGDKVVNEEKGHGAHYWCPPCDANKAQYHPSAIDGELCDVDASSLVTRGKNDDDVEELVDILPILFPRDGISDTIVSVCPSKLKPAFAAGATDQAPKYKSQTVATSNDSDKMSTKAGRGKNRSKSKSGGASPTSKRPTARTSKHSAPTARTSKHLATKKRKADSAVQTSAKRVRRKDSNPSLDASQDEFIGKLVGFYLDSPVGEELKKSFGKKWNNQAICHVLNDNHGHIIGTVMRVVNVGRSKKTYSPSEVNYEVAWEFTGLGETTVSGKHITAAVLIGCQVQSKRQPAVDSTEKCRKGRPARKVLLQRAVSSLNANFSDDEFVGIAPESDDEDGSNNEKVASSSDEEASPMDEDIVEWLTFGENECGQYDDTSETVQGNNNMVVDDSQTGPLLGLHWDTTAKVSNPPDIRRATKGCGVKPQYNYLFKTPIDSFFAVIPYIFWEIFCDEINRYAGAYLKKKNTRQICGYIWKPVSINELLTYFGILIFSMLYPQTGRRVRTAWKNQQVNAWTCHMGVGRFSQINSMLHFNNNDNTEGSARDSLHKIRPLLEILKKTYGRYASFGTEFSFDEATMACFSRYARGLLCFNPQKPTGKFHFKIYMLCCAITNLVVKVRIHTKDASDMNYSLEDLENEEVNKIDKLTSEMCSILEGSGSVVNMDNYYMSTTAAIHLKQKGVLCRGTIRANRKFLPKSVLFTPRECKEFPRGTTRMAVNVDNSLVALGWIDNKVVNFISTADTTDIASVERRVKNEKVEVPAPEVVKNYNKYMGGVDKHDKLRSTFALGKHHKFKKYYVKLMLFLMDIAMTNSWIYYKLENPDKCKKSESRADYFLSVAEHLVRPGFDWATKYKVTPAVVEQEFGQEHFPRGQNVDSLETNNMADMERAVTENKCEFVDFDSLPFDLKKRSKTCQICNYEMRKPKWKGVVMCLNHGVRLCSAVSAARCDSTLTLYQKNGNPVTDFSWTCSSKTSCWNKFHDYYYPKGLYSKKEINVSDATIKFGNVLYSSELYQKKYKALGIEVGKQNGQRKSCMAKINVQEHWDKNN